MTIGEGESASVVVVFSRDVDPTSCGSARGHLDSETSIVKAIGMFINHDPEQRRRRIAQLGFFDINPIGGTGQPLAAGKSVCAL